VISQQHNLLPPPYVHSPEDIERANRAWMKTSLSVGQRPLLEAMNEALGRVGKVKSKRPDLLTAGGTLSRAQIQTIEITDAQGERRRLETYVKPLETALRGLTGITFTGTTLKAYGPSKPGLGPHRDANFPKNETAQVASLALKGLGRFCLWVYPEECVYDGEQAIMEKKVPPENPMILERTADADNPIIVEVNGYERALYPVQSISMSPGDVITVDETPGVGTWQGGGGYTQLAHSAYRIDDIRQALVFRNEIKVPNQAV
jgi:hypothetical protein